MMIAKSALLLAALCLLPVSARSQDRGKGVIEIRAVLQDPVNPGREFFMQESGGAVGKLGLVPEGLSETQKVLPVKGVLALYDAGSVDPAKPGENLVASVRVPNGMNRAIMVVVPAGEGGKSAYRMVLIDDSAGKFPWGESRVLSLIGVETALQAGEHKIPLAPGKITRVPEVRRVNDFRMAQTNFYYKEKESWVAFTERQLQYLDGVRRVFIVFLTPGSKQPFVRTVVDTAPAVLPE